MRRSTRTIGWAFVVVQALLLATLILVVIALSVRSGSALAVVIGAATLAFFIVKSSWEEQRLAERFPDDAAYAARTGRFFPGW